MSIDSKNYLILGYKNVEVKDPYDNEVFLSMIEGRKGEAFILVPNGETFIFGVVLSRIADSYDDEVYEVKNFIGLSEVVHQKYIELFRFGKTFNELSEQPKILHFNHVY